MSGRVKRQRRADDLEVLRLFARRAQAVDEHSLVKNRVGSSLNIRWERGGPVTWSSHEPSQELLESLVARLRRFFPNGDDLNLFRIHNICEVRLEHAEMRAFLRTVREEWSRAQLRGLMGLNVDGREIRPDHVVDLMINGWFLHDEPAKTAELESWVGEVGLMTRHIFIDYVYGAVEAVFSTADVVRIGLERDMFD